jgi:hypothetical protein
MSKNNNAKSFKIPKEIEQQVNLQVIADGYGFRGKSKWISDSIVKLLNFSDEEFIMDCIEYSNDFVSLDKSISFRSTEEAKNLLDEWLVKVRLKSPELEGVRSKIIRSCILQRLIGSVDSLEKFNESVY